MVFSREKVPSASSWSGEWEWIMSFLFLGPRLLCGLIYIGAHYFLLTVWLAGFSLFSVSPQQSELVCNHGSSLPRLRDTWGSTTNVSSVNHRKARQQSWLHACAAAGQGSRGHPAEGNRSPRRKLTSSEGYVWSMSKSVLAGTEIPSNGPFDPCATTTIKGHWSLGTV